jgi:hypothetical protein
MPISQGTKRPDANLENLANPGNEHEVGFLNRAALFKVDISGKILNKNLEGIFLLNPTAWEESKSAKWVAHEVPGQSDPVWQWVSSGPRTVTFEALVTADTSDKIAKAEEEQSKSSVKTSIEAVASIAMDFFKITIPPPRNESTALKNAEILDISDRLNYYRSLLYPEYTDPNNKGVPGRLKASPPLLVLFAGNSISNIPYSDRITNKQDVWILTDLRIRTTKQLANLAPMEAVVTFTL